MGLIVNLYRSTYRSNADVFNGYDTVTVTNVDGPFTPTKDSPAARLVNGPLNTVIIKPDLDWFVDEGLITVEQAAGHICDSGILAATTDSRFGEAIRALGHPGYVGLHVHSFLESWEEYDRTFR